MRPLSCSSHTSLLTCTCFKRDPTCWRKPILIPKTFTSLLKCNLLINIIIVFFTIASMSFLGGNMFLRKSNCKLATCRHEYHAISSSCPRFLFCTSISHFILSTMHIIIIAVQLIEGFVMTSETPGGSTRYFLDMGTSVHVAQESAYTSMFVSPQYSFSSSKIPQRVWLGTEFSSGVYILFGERIVVLLSYRWAIRVQVYELLGLISYQITGPEFYWWQLVIRLSLPLVY